VSLSDRIGVSPEGLAQPGTGPAEQIISEKGLEGLFEALAAGVPLPAMLMAGRVAPTTELSRGPDR